MRKSLNLFLLTLMFAVTANAQTLETPPEWYPKVGESDEYDVAYAWGDTYEIALTRALGKLSYEFNGGEYGEVEGLIGSIWVETKADTLSNSEILESVTVNYLSESDTLMFTLTQGGEKEFFESISNGFDFYDLIMEIIESGSHIKQDIGLIRTYVRLETDLSERIYERFKASEAFKQLQEGLDEVNEENNDN